MTLHEQIKEELKDALRARDEVRLQTVRSILTAFTNESVANGGTPQDMLGDDAALSVITRLAKQRKDSIEQYTKGARDDLAEIEKAELAILETYLPEMMEQSEIEVIVQKKKEELSITDRSQMGQLIGAVMKELKGKADGADVKAVVERALDQ